MLCSANLKCRSTQKARFVSRSPLSTANQYKSDAVRQAPVTLQPVSDRTGATESQDTVRLRLCGRAYPLGMTGVPSKLASPPYASYQYRHSHTHTHTPTHTHTHTHTHIHTHTQRSSPVIQFLASPFMSHSLVALSFQATRVGPVA